jgi:glycyl-tRNA synthetase
LFEHCFYQRIGKTDDEQLNVFGFPPLVAPIKCTVFPLVKIEKFDVVAKKISKALTTAGISHIIDITGTLNLWKTIVFILYSGCMKLCNLHSMT